MGSWYLFLTQLGSFLNLLAQALGLSPRTHETKRISCESFDTLGC